MIASCAFDLTKFVSAALVICCCELPVPGASLGQDREIFYPMSQELSDEERAKIFLPLREYAERCVSHRIVCTISWLRLSGVELASVADDEEIESIIIPGKKFEYYRKVSTRKLEDGSIIVRGGIVATLDELTRIRYNNCEHDISEFGDAATYRSYGHTFLNPLDLRSTPLCVPANARSDIFPLERTVDIYGKDAELILAEESGFKDHRLTFSMVNGEAKARITFSNRVNGLPVEFEIFERIRDPNDESGYTFARSTLNRTVWSQVGSDWFPQEVTLEGQLVRARTRADQKYEQVRITYHEFTLNPKFDAKLHSEDHFKAFSLNKRVGKE